MVEEEQSSEELEDEGDDDGNVETDRDEPDKDIDGDESDEVTPDYIEKCEDLKELRAYAKEFGISMKLSKRQIKKEIIENLRK